MCVKGIRWSGDSVTQALRLLILPLFSKQGTLSMRLSTLRRTLVNYGVTVKKRNVLNNLLEES
jgi:hypothetical protein